MDFEQVRRERLNKVRKIRNWGINPFAFRFDRTQTIDELQRNVAELTNSVAKVRVAGRIVTRLDDGHVGIVVLADMFGKVRVHIEEAVVGQFYELYRLLDVGDFVGVSGTLSVTAQGEPVIGVEELTILSKSIRDLPRDWQYRPEDIEALPRPRYVDLLANPKGREIFVIRACIVNIIRQVFDQIGGLEVETPPLPLSPGETMTEPFTVPCGALDSREYLQIASDAYLKRLIIGGFERVFEISKDFTNEEIDRDYNMEFAQAQIFSAYEDYTDMMDLAEQVFAAASKDILGKLTFDYQDEKIDLTPPWPRRPILELIKEYVGFDIAIMGDAELCVATRVVYQDRLNARNCKEQLALLPSLSRAQMIREIFRLGVAPNLVQPIFVTDFPKEMSPQGRTHRNTPSLTERAELYIYHREIASAFSELNDPVERRERFEEEKHLIKEGNTAIQSINEDIIRALEYGMPPTGRLSVGADRLTMLLTNHGSARDVIPILQANREQPA